MKLTKGILKKRLEELNIKPIAKDPDSLRDLINNIGEEYTLFDLEFDSEGYELDLFYWSSNIRKSIRFSIDVFTEVCNISELYNFIISYKRSIEKFEQLLPKLNYKL